MISVLDQTISSPIQKIVTKETEMAEVYFSVKRDDLIHPWLSGNKWRKAKYNLIFAKENNFNTVITFGGAFSNHIYAIAGACNLLGLKSVGIIRGDCMDHNNPTLSFCASKGMDLHFIDRNEYRLKENSSTVKDIISNYKNHYILPEGGTNSLALQGVAEIWSEIHKQFDTVPDFIFSSAGTGGTSAGLLTNCPKTSKIISFSSLKSNYLKEEIIKLSGINQAHQLIFNADFHFGGYAKYPKELQDFSKKFENQTNIPLDPIYNSKALYGFLQLCKAGFFPKKSSVLWLHTGGIQGKAGMEYLMRK